MGNRWRGFFVAIAALSMSTDGFAAAPRRDWVTAEIYAYNHPFATTATDDLATKMVKMTDGPFAFYRGTAHVFYRDMRTWPGSTYTTAQTGLTWIGGDAHPGNFDAARDGSGKAVFKVADFDEGFLGQYIWDLRRLAAGLVLAGRENGVADSDIRSAVQTMVGAYADKMSDFKGSSAEFSFKLSNGTTSGVVQDTIARADGKTRSALLVKYTRVSGGVRSFLTASDLMPVSTTSYSDIASAIAVYPDSIAPSKRRAASYYTVKDIRRKLGSGVGSLGRLRYYVLIEGPSSSNSDDVILEAKQESGSVVAIANAGGLPAWAYDSHEGERAARTAKAQSLDADPSIGDTTIAGSPFFVRERSPYQEDFDTGALISVGKLQTAATYLGQALASAHALADQDYDSSVVPYSIDKQVTDAITSKSGLKTEIANFAFDYADQVELDWAAFVDAYRAGAVLY